MPLTEEERRKIYEEEKARIEAREQIKEKRKKHGCFTIFIIVAILIFLLYILSLIGRKEQPLTPSGIEAKVKIILKVKKVTYEYGYLKVFGIAENTGNKAAFSPTIKLQIYDESGNTLLAEDIVWPAGHYLKNFDPGSSAAFKMICSVPGEPSQIKYQLSIKDYPFEIQKK
jgi:hypothetical protein